MATAAPLEKLHATCSSIRLATFQARGWGTPIDSVHETIAGMPCSFHLYRAEVPPTVNGGRPFHAILTDGLSDTQVVRGVPRTELLWYVDAPSSAHLEWLRFLCTVHRVDQVDLYHRIIPMTVPPVNLTPLARGSHLSSVTCVTPPLRRDQPPFVVGGAETYTLWVLPITETERDHLDDDGAAAQIALADLLDVNHHPFVLDPFRHTYV